MGNIEPTIERGPLSVRPIARRTRCVETSLAALIMLTTLIIAVSEGLVVTVDDDRGPTESDDKPGIPARILYTTHSPILITGNSEFTSANGVIAGNGSSSNPYIISGWEITAGASDFAAVFIGSTDAFFRLEDCRLTHANGNAIQLDHVWNGFLVNNTCTQSVNGISIAFSESVSIVNNTLSGNQYHGIFMSASERNVILGNNCSGNSFYGIWLGVSHFNTISNNNCSWVATTATETNTGIYVWGSGNSLRGNTCLWNLWEGIVVEGHGNVLGDNVYIGNGRHGIHLISGTGNVLVSNRCSGDLDGNTPGSLDGGILLDGSGWTSVVENICTDARAGILIRGGTKNFVGDNYCSNNSLAGIYVDSWDESAQWNTFSNNTCRNNSHGIMLWQWSSNNTLVGNNCSENGISGINLTCSRDNILTENTCLFNEGYGLSVVNGEPSMENSVSRNNTIWNNTIAGNNGASDIYEVSHVQAYDGGEDNWWNSTDGYGNWWGDWTVPDMDMNGIVDLPYDIGGDAGAKDYYPRTNAETPIPEFSIMPFVALALMAVVVFAADTRRRKKL